MAVGVPFKSIVTKSSVFDSLEIRCLRVSIVLSTTEARCNCSHSTDLTSNAHDRNSYPPRTGEHAQEDHNITGVHEDNSERLH